jgi:hypothetical protein
MGSLDSKFISRNLKWVQQYKFISLKFSLTSPFLSSPYPLLIQAEDLLTCFIDNIRTTTNTPDYGLNVASQNSCFKALISSMIIGR